MNIDDRIQALTESVELLSNMHQDNEKRYAAQFDRLEENVTKLTDMTHRLVRISESLASIVQSHESRLNNIQGG